MRLLDDDDNQATLIMLIVKYIDKSAQKPMSKISKWLANASALLYFGFTSVSIAATSNTLQDYSHTQRTTADGAPAGIISLAQTADGWLWAATANNLYRFDGLRFEWHKLVQCSDFDQDHIKFIRASPTGDIYIGYATAGVSVLHLNGKTERLPLPTSHTSLRALAIDRDGSVWIIDKGIQHLENGKWNLIIQEHRERTTAGASNMLLDQLGQLWAANTKGAWRLDRRKKTFLRVSNASGQLLSAPDGSVWQVDAMTSVVQLSSAPNIRLSYSPLGEEKQSGIFASDASLWLPNCPTLVCRVRPLAHLAKKVRFGIPVTVQELRQVTNLAGQRADSLFLDQEGNVWVATEAGLHRFRQNMLIRSGLSGPGGNYSLATDGSGRIWAADRTTSSVWQLPPHGAPKIEKRGTVTVVAKGRQGSVLFAGRRGIERMGRGNKELIELPLAPDGTLRDYQLLSVIDDGRVLWINSVEAGIAGWHSGKWWKRSEFNFPSQVVKTGVAGFGQLWIGTFDRSLVFYDNDKLTTYSIDELGAMTILYQSDGVFISGANGSGIFKDGRLRRLGADNPDVLRDVSGMVVTPGGDRWLNGAAGLMRVRFDDWERSAKNPLQSLRYELFGALDGYPGRAVTSTRLPTMISSDGHNLWMLGTDGVVRLDTAALPKSQTVPRPVILGVASDDVIYPAQAKLQLPPGTDRFRIMYTAPLLRAPENARFEFRLDGVDDQWQEVGNRRATTYTNIGPGEYTFHLRVFNEAGICSDADAVMQVIIQPTLMQALWLKFLIIVAGAVIIYFAYRYRKQRLAQQLIERLETRSAHRERRAAELNDTVIQSMHGVLLFAENVAEKYTGQPEAKDRLDRAIQHASNAIFEGRDLVASMLHGCEDELIDMFDSLVQRETISVPVLVQQKGVSRTVRSVVKDELFAVGREALRNALSHCQASGVTVRLTYASKKLQLEVSHKGMLTSTAEPTEELDKLCHRAAQIGAKCTYESRRGDNIARISIPAKLAYQESDI